MEAVTNDIEDIWQLMDALFTAYGSEDVGDLLADEVNAGRLSVEQAINALNCGRWAGQTNGAALKPTLDRWLREGSDLNRVKMALGQDVYPLDAELETREVLVRLLEKWPEVAADCQRFLRQS